MQSDLAKVLHPIAGKSMLEHVVSAVSATTPAHTVVTIGPATEAARQIDFCDRVVYAWQSDADGTAGAVRAALDHVPGDVRWLLVVNGDVPLVHSADLRALLRAAQEQRPLVGLLAFEVDDPSQYGRVIVEDDEVVAVVEAADDDAHSTSPGIVNSGVYCFDLTWLRESISGVSRSRSGEYYLTALIEMAHRDRKDASEPGAVLIQGEAASLLGVDDRIRLVEAEREMQRRIQERHLTNGVTIVQPSSTQIEVDVEIGADTRIEPGTILRRGTRIGSRCVIGPNSMIEGSSIGDGCQVRASWLEWCQIGNQVTVGPFAHLRAGTVLDDGVHVGNYAEIKNSHVGTGSKVPHFSYLGDAEVGRDVNYGAGAITCNFDGVKKHRTKIGDHAFIGSDTLLIAPVEIGDDARTGAGAVVTRSVAAGKTVVGMPARPIQTRSSNERQT